VLGLFLKFFPLGFDKTWWHIVVQMSVMFLTRNLQPEDKYRFLVYAHEMCIEPWFHLMLTVSYHFPGANSTMNSEKIGFWCCNLQHQAFIAKNQIMEHQSELINNISACI